MKSMYKLWQLCLNGRLDWTSFKSHSDEAKGQENRPWFIASDQFCPIMTSCLSPASHYSPADITWIQQIHRLTLKRCSHMPSLYKQHSSEWSTGKCSEIIWCLFKVKTKYAPSWNWSYWLHEFNREMFWMTFFFINVSPGCPCLDNLWSPSFVTSRSWRPEQECASDGSHILVQEFWEWKKRHEYVHRVK